MFSFKPCDSLTSLVLPYCLVCIIWADTLQVGLNQLPPPPHADSHLPKLQSRDPFRARLFTWRPWLTRERLFHNRRFCFSSVSIVIWTKQKSCEQKSQVLHKSIAELVDFLILWHNIFLGHDWASAVVVSHKRKDFFEKKMRQILLNLSRWHESHTYFDWKYSFLILFFYIAISICSILNAVSTIWSNGAKSFRVESYHLIQINMCEIWKVNVLIFSKLLFPLWIASNSAIWEFGRAWNDWYLCVNVDQIHR